MFTATIAFAQLQITSPQSRIVYQRNQANQATVLVTGLAPALATRIEARLTPINGGETTDWIDIPIISGNKAFKGAITATAGWYQLSLRTWNENSLLAESSVDRVGIGEVFIAAGQSNAFGVQATNGSGDDRVSCVDFKDDNVNEQLLPVAFSQAVAGANIGPSNPLHIWGMLGEQLVRRLNVPVLILGAAQPGTNSEQWRKTADGTGESSGLPYRRLGSALLHYAARTGLRAVLWHQGEGDLGRGADQYFNNVQYIINKSRQQLNHSSLAWVISRVTYTFGQTDNNIITAQNRLISLIPNAFAGPNTDVLTGTENRFDDVHFGGVGLTRLTDLWNQSLTDNFFNQSIPFSVGNEAPIITTGHIIPANRASGERIWVSYVQKGPFNSSNQFKAQLLRADGSIITESSVSTQNPIPLQLPTDLPTGMYQTRVVATQLSIVGTASEPFRVTQGGTPTGGNEQPIQQNVVGGTPDASINRIGYRYDYPSHGFTLFVNATGPTEVRLERIDGGGFGESNWGNASSNNELASFNLGRYYSPLSVGVGGVEPGRYRMHARKVGDSGNGIWVEVTLVDGHNTIYQAGSTEQALPEIIITTPPSTTTTTPPSTTTTTPPDPTTQPGTPPTTTYVQRVGYKYDAPTHGFQFLAQAPGAVEMKLERTDGAFGESNWAIATQGEEFFSFNNFRYYSPIAMGIGGVEPGKYRLSARKPGEINNSVSIEIILQHGIHTIAVSETGQTSPPLSWDKPMPIDPTPVTGDKTGEASIQSIGYKYDMPAHGFQLLTRATGPVEMRLERLDGYFGDINWGMATAGTDYSGYNFYRNYSPLALGVGGVEPGRYRLSVRLVGDTGNGTTIDITLQNGTFASWAPAARQAISEAGTSSYSPESSWRVWPNPANQDVTISLPETISADKLRVDIMTTNGQTIPATKTTVSNGQLKVELHEIPTGLYLIRISDDLQPLQTVKVIKQ